MRFLAQLEPDALLAAFVDHPPPGFQAAFGEAGVPVFDAPFDLLTTAEDDLRHRVDALPLARYWRRALRWHTRFVGSTVTEYALLPSDADAAALARRLRERYGRERRLCIVKDLPVDSPLLGEEDNRFAAEFADALQAEGFVLLEGQALAWVPIDFADAEAYLARLSSSRRKDIRRKLRARDSLAIECVPTGDARFRDEAVLAEFDALYRNVYAQSEIHFDELSADYLRAILRDGGSGGQVFVYRHDGAMIGWNLCYEYAGKLVDKYVGFAYPQAREHNLYFVSWMHNLEYARARGLSHYVAGWTDPQIKAYLGASMTFTRHAVYARNPLLRALLRRVAGRFESDRAWQDAQAAESRG